MFQLTSFYILKKRRENCTLIRTMVGVDTQPKPAFAPGL